MGARKIVFNTGEPAYAVDRRGRIVVWNAAAEQAFGFPDSKALGQHCWELLAGEDDYGNQYCCEGCPLRSMAFQNKAVKRCKIQFKTASHQRKGFTVSTLVLMDAPGKEILVHLCRPESEDTDHTDEHEDATQHGNNLAGILTKREIEVLMLLAEGKATRDISTMLCVSVPTVRNHIQHILNKLKAHSRLEAIMQGRRLGLI